ncbi:MmcB family DNA repair protein [Clostridium sp. YIM B02551]|uniref:MmcB family DNA repair protein n=1 Tax=Clostridium sp. YIM B02551 TaxID=2910679 RepID=UPI001EEA7F4B|nr:MmcB family DNA repair protein [Clostridium sp. YIM B02551]
MKKVSEFKSERELQEDLAEYMRNSGMLTFTEIQIPGMNSSRADLIAMTPHRYATKDIRLYEVKLTRGVWLSDNKFQKYLECCNRMYIACPKGVIKKEEVPNEIGLITRNDNGWRVIKSPKLNINPSKMNVDFILSLIYRGYEENRIQRDLRDRIITGSNIKLSAQAKSIGWEIARRIDKSAESQIEAWYERVWEVFMESGFEKPEEVANNHGTLNLPSLYEIKNTLLGATGLMNEVKTIKAIGKYLENIELPEECDSWLGSRKENRERALNLINQKEQI